MAPTDEELLELMPQGFRDDLALVSRMAAHGAGPEVQPGLFRVTLNTGALDYARAVWDRARAALAAESVAAPAEPTDEAAVEAAAELIYMEAMEWAARQSIPSGHINIPAWQQGGNSDAQEVARRTARAVMSRFGHQPAPPADGEVAELVAWLRAWARGTLEEGQPATSRSLTRAADLLERQAAPVPMAVSERLPGAEERDSDECCWWFYPETDDTLPVWVLSYGNDAWEIEKPPSPTHWLPAHALPLPSGEVDE